MPYDDQVVYTVDLTSGRTLTGRFTNTESEAFWTMEIVGQDERNAADWIDISPAHIVAIYAAAGEAYRTFTAQFDVA